MGQGDLKTPENAEGGVEKEKKSYESQVQERTCVGAMTNPRLQDRFLGEQINCPRESRKTDLGWKKKRADQGGRGRTSVRDKLDFTERREKRKGRHLPAYHSHQ